MPEQLCGKEGQRAMVERGNFLKKKNGPSHGLELPGKEEPGNLLS